MVGRRLSPELIALGVVGIAAGFLLLNRDAGKMLGSRAVDAVDSVMGGVVTGIGEKLGIPPTDESACDKAIREGRTWDASFACPAGRFLRYLAGGESSGGASGGW